VLCLNNNHVLCLNNNHFLTCLECEQDLSKFPRDLTVALFCGGNDYLADPTDVTQLISLLPQTPLGN
jgi:hypothetical protein